ncbi:hypothetical protein CASFOL_041233 [Castilleja foliolosa]|uniref:F-box domain-containing protein n=1 Tax=Castilleja foliolosa TaxID=1961234 RepID=A0ABD3BFJ1_9LAMI
MTSWSKTSPPCKRDMSKATNIDSLPDDVLFEILLRVPAQDLYDSTRFVCHKWYNMINTRNFKHSHLQRSTPGLLAVSVLKSEQAFMTIQNGRIEISKWSYGVGCRVLSSCNGLLLDGRYITNPVTKQHFALEKLTKTKRCALAYAASSRAYKVVCASYSPFDRKHGLVCAIMTVGVDTDWRCRVNTQHLSLKAKELLKESLLTTRGFVHWVRNDCPESVLSMNVESEIITQIPGPCLRDDCKSLYCHYLPMGRYLSMFIDRGEFSWEVWKMKPEIGEWTKMPNIDLEPQKLPKHLIRECKRLHFKGPMLIPVGWSNSGEVLFFDVYLYIVAFNVRTREIDLCKLGCMLNLFLDHRTSLEWLD